MAYVIAEPCINTKDTACVDVCPVDCIHPRKDEAAFQRKPCCTSVRWNASTVALACRFVRSLRFSLWKICRRSGSHLPPRTRSGTKRSRLSACLIENDFQNASALPGRFIGLLPRNRLPFQCIAASASNQLKSQLRFWRYNCLCLRTFSRNHCHLASLAQSHFCRAAQTHSAAPAPANSLAGKYAGTLQAGEAQLHFFSI